MGRFLFRTLLPHSPRFERVGDYGEGALLYLFWKLMRLLPPQQASACGRRLMRKLGPRSHKHRQVLRNLALAFPTLDEPARASLARDIWGNFGAVMAEYPHLDTLADAASPFVDIRMDTQAGAILDAGRAAIYVTAHLANWELVGALIARAGVPLSVIYGPQRNSLLDRLIVKQRRAVGIRLIDKHNGVRRLVQEIRAGRSVGLLPDQRVDRGEPLPFFGFPAPTTTSPAWLALKLGCPLIPVQVERTGDARFIARFHPPLLRGRAHESARDPVQVTLQLNQLFEGWIRHRPDQWVCIKRRWQRDIRPAAGMEGISCA